MPAVLRALQISPSQQKEASAEALLQSRCASVCMLAERPKQSSELSQNTDLLWVQATDHVRVSSCTCSELSLTAYPCCLSLSCEY